MKPGVLRFASFNKYFVSLIFAFEHKFYYAFKRRRKGKSAKRKMRWFRFFLCYFIVFFVDK